MSLVAGSGPGGAMKPGEVFADRYEVIAAIDSGGTATVYKVTDQLTLETIALKILQPAAAQNPKILSDFRRELLMARRLSHPNVVRIFDIGEHNGQLYLSMEFIEGQTLAAYLHARKKLPTEEFLGIFRQLAAALEHVHQSHIIHRDIKPQNVMMTRNGTLKLMDFGLARDQGGRPTVGVLIGTPAYMSPEHILGQPLSVASDIYSAGCVCYELLTGQRAFQSMALADRVTATPPSLPSGIPPAIAATVARAMNPEPSQRFASVADMRASMEGTAGSASSTPLHTLAAIQSDAAGNPEAILPLFGATVAELAEIHRGRQYQAQLVPSLMRVAAGGAVEVPVRPLPGDFDTNLTTALKYASRECYVERGLATQEARVSSDLYVCGFIFYELFLGRNLFNAEFPGFAGSEGDPRWLQWHSDLSKAARPIIEILPNFPKPVAELLARMLAKEASKRPKSFDEALTVLQSVNSRIGKTRVIRPDRPAVAHSAGGAAAGRPPAAPSSDTWKLVGIGLAVALAIVGAALAAYWFLVPKLLGP